MDVIMNGQAQGDIATKLLANNMDPGILRPFVGNDGRSYATIMENGKPTVKLLNNATATLRKDAWQILDAAVVKAAKPRLKAVADLRGAGLTYNIPNGMSKTVVQTETQSDISDAVISMSGIRQSDTDRPVYEITNLPLPIIHKDFQFPTRQVMVSRNSGSPLDTSTAELAARRVAEQAEQLLLGTSGSYAYGGGTIYGYTNFPSRLTKTMTAPTAGGWTAATTVNEVLEMRLQAQQAFHYGPYMIYCSTAWDVYLDDDYSANKGDNTLRDRLKAINEISDVRTLDYLDTAGTSYVMLLVQMTSDVVREVVGMDINTVQWETQGGMMLNFKVMAILVPQLRADQNSNTGIVHGTTA
ncbi:MAG: major capsid protein [Candidatus Heimdallarchaeaceae archaeon]